MTTEDFHRKLTAILSADVVGYSRLMGEDEAATVKTLETYKGVMSSLIRQHRGRVVDSPGDNLLAEFGSVVDAVQCAVSIQKELQARNADLPTNRKMEFRIGINLGDVIEEEDRIYGDGVNIAARLESLADPGGICISKTAFDHIESKLPLGYEFLGEQTVKNIARPIGAYKVLMETRVVDAKTKQAAEAVSFWRRKSVLSLGIIVILVIAGVIYWNFYLRGPSIEQASTETKPAPVLSDVKEAPKSIAVLPFEDLSPDKDQEYFAEGLAEELINKLAQVKDLQVTARTSSFYFKGKNVDIRTISETLGVTYLLEGSVRKSGNQLRVTAQLIKAVDSYHLFSKTYDRELKDIFSIQDDIAKAVTRALSVTLGVGEFRRPGMTRNIEAYDEFLRAGANLYKSAPDSTLVAIDQYQKALDIDPNFGLGWRQLATSYYMGITLLPPGETGDFNKRVDEARKNARAVAPDMPELLLDTAQEKQQDGNWLEAERIYRQILDEQVITINSANSLYGRLLLCVGRINDSFSYLQRAKRLNPLDAQASFYLSLALFDSNRIDEALAEASRGQELEGLDTIFSHIELIAALESNDRSKAADIINANYSPAGDYPDTTMLRLAKILLMEDKDAVLSELKELSEASDVSSLTRMVLANVTSVLGAPELAFEIYLESEFFDVPTALWIPTNRGIRQLPAFKNWVRKTGLYDYWRASGKWSDLCRPVGDDDFVCD